MIARILSPFLRWLDRRIDARIAARDAVIVSGLAPRVAAARADLTRALDFTARRRETSGMDRGHQSPSPSDQLASEAAGGSR